MRLAAVQYQPPKADPAVARARLAGYVRQAAEAGADLIVCPEMTVSGYIWPDEQAILPHTEPADGPTTQMLAEAVQGTSAWVVAGIAERDGAELYNSAVIVDRHGLQACYRKVLLFDADRTWAQPGTERLLIRAPFGTFAPAICMDLNDVRFTRWLGEAQPDAVAFCTNWIDQGYDTLPYWRARLGGWRGWFVAANAWGADVGVRFSGRSTILDPEGHAVARASRIGDGVVFALGSAPQGASASASGQS